MNRILTALLAIFCISTFNLSAQIEDPIKWEINLYETAEEGQIEVIYHASLDTCWHIYSQFLGSDDGPIATAFYNNANEIVEGVTECTPLIAYDPNFMMDLKYFDEEVYWSSIISLSDLESADTLKGSLLYMV